MRIALRPFRLSRLAPHTAYTPRTAPCRATPARNAPSRSPVAPFSQRRHHEVRAVRVDRGMSRRAITGEEDMNKAELGARPAAEFSLTRATADRMFGAVFAAIGESRANKEPVSIAGFGNFSIRARPARQGRPYRRDHPDRRLAHARVLRPARPFATPSTSPGLEFAATSAIGYCERAVERLSGLAATRTDCDHDARRCSGFESVLFTRSRPDNRNSRPERPAPATLLRWEPR